MCGRLEKAGEGRVLPTFLEVEQPFWQSLQSLSFQVSQPLVSVSWRCFTCCPGVETEPKPIRNRSMINQNLWCLSSLLVVLNTVVGESFIQRLSRNFDGS